jgi:hypothetical protein
VLWFGVFCFLLMVLWFGRLIGWLSGLFVEGLCG